MKRGRSLSSLSICACIFLMLLGGCGKKSLENEHISSSLKPEGYGLEGGAGNGGDEQDERFSAGDVEGLDRTGENPLIFDAASDEYRATYGRSTAPLYPVYFDFDSALINPDQLAHLNESGDYLTQNGAVNVVVEGNCDERGTTDYNLALGELRAINVKKYLTNLGVAEGRITTISYGSQRPLYPGSDEQSWAKNRRADLVMP